MLVGAGSDVAVTSDMENRDTRTSPSLQVCSTCMAALHITLMHVVDWPHTRSIPWPFATVRVLLLVWLRFPHAKHEHRLQMKCTF